MKDKLKKHFEGTDIGRREALKTLLAGAAFAVPTVTTFGMGGARAGIFPSDEGPGCFGLDGFTSNLGHPSDYGRTEEHCFGKNRPLSPDEQAPGAFVPNSGLQYQPQRHDFP